MAEDLWAEDLWGRSSFFILQNITNLNMFPTLDLCLSCFFLETRVQFATRLAINKGEYPHIHHAKAFLKENSVVAKQNLVVSSARGFDYAPLTTLVAEQVRITTTRIRQRITRTIEDIIAVGNDLLTVKNALPHGHFGPWLHLEFGWTDRTARHFMAVAEQFGPKTEMISDLSISPSAAYLLSAPSAPFEARQAALDRAQSGERITAGVATEIIGAARKKKPLRARPQPWEKKWQRFSHVVDRFRKTCDSKELSQFARLLRQLVNVLENEKQDKNRRVQNNGKKHQSACEGGKVIKLP
jgi:hypothetical protein